MKDQLSSFESVQKKQAEVWHENETLIVIKMLDQSVKSKDEETILELQKSLLKLEGKEKASLAKREDSQLLELLPKRIRQLALNLGLYFHKGSLKTKVAPFSVRETEYLEKAMMQNTRQYDAQITIMMTGDAKVGKTSLMNTWLGVENSFVTKETIGYYSD